MYCHDFQVVLQEVPGEISLCFSISGCPIQCIGCHSPFLWKEGSGRLLTKDWFNTLLEQYKTLASCVVFMGGEWHKQELIALLKLAKSKNYKTCLYTGQEQVRADILKELTWVKMGKWDTSLGGLNSETTNQRFIEVHTNTIRNNLFTQKQNQ